MCQRGGVHIGPPNGAACCAALSYQLFCVRILQCNIHQSNCLLLPPYAQSLQPPFRALLPHAPCAELQTDPTESSAYADTSVAIAFSSTLQHNVLLLHAREVCFPHLPASCHCSIPLAPSALVLSLHVSKLIHLKAQRAVLLLLHLVWRAHCSTL